MSLSKTSWKPSLGRSATLDTERHKKIARLLEKQAAQIAYGAA